MSKMTDPHSASLNNDTCQIEGLYAQKCLEKVIKSDSTSKVSLKSGKNGLRPQ